jgi:hypothetical protein
MRLHHVPGDDLAELHAGRLLRQCQCHGCIGKDCFAAFKRGLWTPGLGRLLPATYPFSLPDTGRSWPRFFRPGTKLTGAPPA